jgi:nucleotide-binding universal stress UspA family protein
VTAPARIAVGYDGSPDSEAALRWAASMSAALGAVLCIVHAVGLLEHAGLAPLSAHEERARTLAVDQGLDARRVEWRVLDGDPDSALRRAAQGDEAAELIVVGTRGAAARPGTLLGSTSLGLAERAPVPVVVVPVTPNGVKRRREPGGSPPA